MSQNMMDRIPGQDEFRTNKKVYIHSSLEDNEIFPIPPGVDMKQDSNKFKFQRWPIFEVSMQLTHLNNDNWQMIQKINGRYFQKYNELAQAQTPSLWAYFNTLPAWCRDNVFIRNVFMAMEYKKPGMTMRNKEVAVNWACAQILPMDELTEKMILLVCASRPI